MDAAPRDGRALIFFDGLPFVVRWKEQEKAFLQPDGNQVPCATHWKRVRAPFFWWIRHQISEWRFRRLIGS